jgi:hypothetical protein
MNTKECTKCKNVLSLNLFTKCSKSPDGLQYECIECGKQRKREWREKNKDHHNAYMVKYREENRELCIERGKIYREKNLEKELLRSKNYKLNNPVIRQLGSYKTNAIKNDAYHEQHDPKIEAVLIEMKIRLQKCLGVKFILHKIIPMNKGGYHHHQNIQVIPKALEAIANKLYKTDQPILKSWRDVPAFLHTRALGIEDVKMEMNNIKKCYSCCNVLPIESFYILNKKYKNRSSYCGKCSSENYKSYSLQYPEKRKQRQKNYCINNRNKVNLYSSKRRALKKNATHPDHDQNIEKTYVDMRIRLEDCLGIKYNVDHILPLTKGGYHHHRNLQTIPESLNDSKRANLKFRHQSLVHWTELPAFLLDRVELRHLELLNQL